MGSDHCVSQQAFYRLRSAANQAFGVPGDTITPDTRWATLFGKRPRADWQILRHAVGSVEWPGLFWTADGPRTETVGETAEFLALQAAVAARRPGAPWSRREIDFIVRGLAVEELGIADIP